MHLYIRGEAYIAASEIERSSSMDGFSIKYTHGPEQIDGVDGCVCIMYVSPRVQDRTIQPICVLCIVAFYKRPYAGAYRTPWP